MPSPKQVAQIIFGGGLNLDASVLEMSPGEAVQLFNYEVSTLGRYQRVIGYERFDGQPAPSEVVPKDLSGYPFANDEDERVAVQAEKDARRVAIQPIEGSGPIRGIARYNGHVYAFRDDASGTQSYMWRSTPTGWQRVTTPSLTGGGKYDFRIANFGAGSDTIKLYGCDGVNKLFEFDGERYIEIDSPIAHKNPTHIEVLASQVLVASFDGGTIATTLPGDPTNWTTEIGTGDTITGIDLQANNSCAVFCRNRTYVLYGTSSADYQFQDLSKSTGAAEWSIQTIGDSIYIDDRGLTRLNRVQEFGNFDMATMSQKVDSLINRYARRITDSFCIKEKNQVRWCFDDGTGLICTFSGKEVAGFSTFDYGKIIRCTFSGEDENGKEVIYFGSDDGYVYQAEKGFSFDGEPIEFVFRPAFAHFGYPDMKKQWSKLVIEASALNDATVTCVPDFDYSDPNIPYHRPKTLVITSPGGYWDEASWDEALWSESSIFTSDFYIDGLSRNISTTFSGSATGEPPHIIHSVLAHFVPRGRRR